MNLDLDDIKIMLENSGEGITAFGKGEGQDKVKLVIEQIINSPFIFQKRERTVKHYSRSRYWINGFTGGNYDIK